MRVTYDAETDALTVTLRDDGITESDEVVPGVVVGFGQDGKIVRFEILEASKAVQHTREMPFTAGA